MLVERTDTSVLGRWWWTIDKVFLSLIILLLLLGVVLVASASPPVAMRIGAPSYYFVIHQLIFIPPVLLILFFMSAVNLKTLKRVSLIVYALAILGTILTLIVGTEIKGATRWISICGLSIQPSEFLKPTVLLITAMLFSKTAVNGKSNGKMLAIFVYLISIGLLLLQPDLGMTIVITLSFFAQLFFAGLPLLLVIGGVGLVVVGGVSSYFIFPHVASRVNRFLDPASGDNYQIQKALESFSNGGWFGTGPGQGNVKFKLPDAHADFIFAVASEEFGVIAASLIVILFAVIVIRILRHALKENDYFKILALGGLGIQVALQSLVHIYSSLHLIPTKGMTLPFISYGGSSLLSIAFIFGVVLALTKKRYTSDE